jgi:hemerythrin-like domain-containing protein
MKALNMLIAEHRAIERELDVLVDIAADLEKRAPVPLDTAEALVDFLQRVADGVHHRKEEELLFPLLAKRGVKPDESVIRPLLQQHESGRFHVRRMREELGKLSRGDRQAALDFASYARTYAEMIRAHIQIEDEILYPAAARVLTPDDDLALQAAFADMGRLQLNEVV